MCKLVLDGGNVSSFTSVSNVFIDEYMNKANGEFVKIYLHLLRMVSKMKDAPEEFSTEKIADHFNILESDVYRALTYWNDEEVLSLSFNDEGKIEGVAGLRDYAVNLSGVVDGEAQIGCAVASVGGLKAEPALHDEDVALGVVAAPVEIVAHGGVVIDVL